MRDFTGESSGGELKEETARPGPELGQNVVLDEGDVRGEAVEVVDELVLGLGAAIRLTLVKDFLGDFQLQNLGRLSPLEHAVLAKAKEALEEELGD